MTSHNQNMAGKVAMVTGANSGIGLVTARELADRGAAVVLVCRDRERGEAALTEIKSRSAGGAVELMLCDLASQKSIREFAEEFKRTHDRLDVLVNNAGVYFRNRTVVEGNLETTFAVNHLAYFLLTNLLLDVIERSAPARIINVSSGAHTYGRIDFDDLQGEKNYKRCSRVCELEAGEHFFHLRACAPSQFNARYGKLPASGRSRNEYLSRVAKVRRSDYQAGDVKPRKRR